MWTLFFFFSFDAPSTQRADLGSNRCGVVFFWVDPKSTDLCFESRARRDRGVDISGFFELFNRTGLKGGC